jgi:flagellar protein FliL
MSADTPTAETEEEPKKKSKKKLIIIAVVGLVVVAAAAHFTILKPKAAAAATKPVAGKILTIPVQTLNLADGHLLQVGVALQLTTTADIPSIQALEPKIDALTLNDLSPYTYHQLLGNKARDAAQSQLGKDIAALLNAKAPGATATTSTTTPTKTTKATKTTTKGAKHSKHAKSAKHASKGAKKTTTPTAKAAATPPPQVLGTFFTTFLMQ